MWAGTVVSTRSGKKENDGLNRVSKPICIVKEWNNGSENDANIPVRGLISPERFSKSPRDLTAMMKAGGLSESGRAGSLEQGTKRRGSVGSNSQRFFHDVWIQIERLTELLRRYKIYVELTCRAELRMQCRNSGRSCPTLSLHSVPQKAGSTGHFRGDASNKLSRSCGR